MTRLMVAIGATLLVLPACSRSSAGTAETASAGPTRSGNVVRFEAQSSQLERIEVAAVKEDVLPVDEFEVPGSIAPVPGRLARLALPAPGRVRSVNVTLGDRVSAGQVLLTLETPDVSQLQSARRQSLADVKQRQASLSKAEADAGRMRDLLANRAAAQKDVLAAENDLAVATAALEQARATADDTARRLRLYGVDPDQQDPVATLRSPIGGDVIELSAAPGDYRSDTAAPVIAIADLSRVWAVASIPESAVARIQLGQPVSVAVAAYLDQPSMGRVARIADAVDAETRSLRIIAELDNRDRRLKPEMFARVRYSGPARPVVTVPIGAVLQDEGRTSVYVERRRGEFERRDVSTGPRRENSIVVTRGLAKGDRVVIGGTLLLAGQQ